MNSKFWHRSPSPRPWKDDDVSARALLARLLRDENGSYLIYATLAIPVFIGVAAFASEGSLLFYNHRALQSATDAAAYSAAVAYSDGDTSPTALTTQAQAIIASYGFAVGTGNNQVDVATPTVTPNYAGMTNITAIQVNTTRPQLPLLSSVWLGNPINVSVSAIAIVNGNSSGLGGGNCLVSLGNTATGNNAADAIKLQGTPTIDVAGCGVYSNSNDCLNGAVSVSLGGHATINAGSLGSAGCVSVGGASSINLPGGGAYTQQNGTISDPYAGTTVPTSSSAGSCVATASTLCPGVYSGGISLAGGTYTLSPGIYILESAGGSPAFQVGPGHGGTTVNGTGVTLVFTSATPNVPSSYPSTMMAVLSNGNVNLTAPTTGPTAGFVMMGDRTMPFGTTFSTHSNPNVTLSGTVYVPKGSFDWGGNAASGGGSSCLQLVVNTISMSGNSAFGGTGCSLSSGGGAGGGGKPIGSVVTLVD